MRAWVIIFSLGLLFFIASSLTVPRNKNDRMTEFIGAYFKKEAAKFFSTTRILETAVAGIDGKNPRTLRAARLALKECRLRYKHISFFLEYFFYSESLSFNAPPKYEVEEPYLEYQAPKGFQLIESILYDTHAAAFKTELVNQAKLIELSAADLPSLLYHFAIDSSAILESLKLELIRVMTLYITGYDAPYLRSGIEESRESLMTIRRILAYLVTEHPEYDSSAYYLDGAVAFLRSNPDFNSFDRLTFLTRYALPLQAQLAKLTKSLNLQSNNISALNWNALGLFSEDAINKNAFPHRGEQADTGLINLGKILFLEKGLSGDGTRSCASCHSPSNYFTDGLARNISLDGRQRLSRNTMGLLYACYQYAQFWDGRSKSLEEQIETVLKNKLEMDANEDTIMKRISQNSIYTEDFRRYWPRENDAVSITHIAEAIAGYIRTLTPFNSPFDKYIHGDHFALTKAQMKGFNLFMGKAECGTCHFAPLFNGLTPPLYKRTEYEVIGTPQDDDLQNPKPDSDEGRYSSLPISFYKGAFKTPTVRNAEKTGPYMHNGGFQSLEKLVDFYNKGGGRGLGLQSSNQTLNETPLHLTAEERSEIVSFIKALTDKCP